MSTITLDPFVSDDPDDAGLVCVLVNSQDIERFTSAEARALANALNDAADEVEENATMNNRADDLLTKLRRLMEHSRTVGGQVYMVDLFADLDAHLSAGGTPPEAWREGPDAPASARYWSMPADPGAGHPMPYAEHTYGIVDEEAGGIIAYVHLDNVARIIDGLTR